MPTPTITRLDELNRILHCEEEEVKEELNTTSHTNEMGEINVTKIIEGLWLGNEASALNRDFLQENNIQSVIRIQSYDTSETVKDMYRELEIAYEYYQVDDVAGEDIKSELSSIPESISTQLRAKYNVLVHCRQGASRSPTFVIAYLMEYEKMDFSDAYTCVKTQRNIVDINLSFLGDLMTLES